MELPYLGFRQLSLEELQRLSVSFLTVLQDGQLLLHLPLQEQQQTATQLVHSHFLGNETLVKVGGFAGSSLGYKRQTGGMMESQI